MSLQCKEHGDGRLIKGRGRRMKRKVVIGYQSRRDTEHRISWRFMHWTHFMYLSMGTHDLRYHHTGMPNMQGSQPRTFTIPTPFCPSRILTSSTQHLCLSPPPTPTSRTRKVRSTSLQMLQYLRRIRAINIEAVLSLSSIRRVPPTNLLDDIIRVSGANDRNFRGQPLLKGLRSEEAVCGEPACHGRADADVLCERGAVGREDDVAFVDGDVFLRV